MIERKDDGTSHLYVNEGSRLDSRLVLQYTETGGARHYPLSDLLGSVTGLTAGAGLLTDTWCYGAFGRVLARTGTTETPFQYVGEYGTTRRASG